METLEELKKEREKLIEKLQGIDRYVRNNTNKDERGIYPRDKNEMLKIELSLILDQAETLNHYILILDKRIEILELKQK